MKISALLSHGSGPGELVAAELDDPRSDEVIVRIEAVGVCHTDLVTRTALGNRPAVLGHEGCGIVEHLGAAVDSLQVGQRVVISFASCGSCAQCRAGHPAYCGWATALNASIVKLSGSRLSLFAAAGYVTASRPSFIPAYRTVTDCALFSCTFDLIEYIRRPPGCGTNRGMLGLTNPFGIWPACSARRSTASSLYTASDTGRPVSSSCCSMAPKKNARFCTMGPPIDPPNCWRLNCTFSRFACSVKKSFAVSLRSR